MLAYIVKRLLLMIPTLLGILLITFAVIQFVPGGPVEQLITKMQAQQSEAASGNMALYRGEQGLTEEQLEQLNQYYGFDKPWYQRFFQMIGNYLTFNLGTSYYHHKSVNELVLEKLPVSMSLGLWTFFLTYLISVPLGIAKAVRDGTRFDVMSSTIVLIGYAIPGFVLAIALLVLFGGGSFFDLFPLRNLVSDNWHELSLIDKILDYFWHLTLPLISLSISSFAIITMLTKNSFLEEIRKGYVMTARTKGLTENQVLYKHVFRNAMIPLVTGFPAAFIAAFFTGSLLIETVFSLDGLGLLSYNSVIQRDYPVVMGTLYLFSLLGLLAKLLTDISYVIIDPRIHFDAK